MLTGAAPKERLDRQIAVVEPANTFFRVHVDPTLRVRDELFRHGPQ